MITTNLREEEHIDFPFDVVQRESHENIERGAGGAFPYGSARMREAGTISLRTVCSASRSDLFHGAAAFSPFYAEPFLIKGGAGKSIPDDSIERPILTQEEMAALNSLSGRETLGPLDPWADAELPRAVTFA